MRTPLCRALVSAALLAGIGAPAVAGTAVAIISHDRTSLTLVSIPSDIDGRLSYQGREVRDPEAVALSPDGAVALAYEPGTRKLKAIRNDAERWETSCDPPSPRGWVGARSGRLLNFQDDGTVLVDVGVGAVVAAPAQADRIDLLDCASWGEGGDEYCLDIGGGVVRISPDGDVLPLAGRFGGDAIEPGLDGHLVLISNDRIGVVDPADLQAGVAVGVPGTLGISSDPASGLLLVQIEPRRFQLRDLASLLLLREFGVTGDPVHEAALLHGGTGIIILRDDSAELLDLQGAHRRQLGSGGDEMMVRPWREPQGPLPVDAASQGSVDNVNSKLDARLDVAVSSRATQASIDQANAKLDATVSSRASQSSVDQANARLDATLSSRASQASVDALAGDLAGANARLDVAVSSRATQASVDQANAKLDASISSRASQSSVDQANAQLDVAVSSRASQASVDQANARLDVAVSTRATQSSVDGVASDIDGVAGDVDGVASQVDAVGSDVDAAAADLASLRGLVDVGVSTRASQSSVDGMASRVTRIDGLMDASVASRATQDSLDALADRLEAASDDAAEAQAALLEALTLSSRRGIEGALLSNVVEPMFLIPGGADADPALDGATCPGLAPAGHAGVHVDGLFETVRCVTRRAIDAMAAIGEDTRTAERSFADGEAERLRARPAYRAAVDDYKRALEALSRGR